MELRITRALWVVIVVKISLLDSTSRNIKGYFLLHIVGIICYCFYSSAEVFCSGHTEHNSKAIMSSSAADASAYFLGFLKHDIKISVDGSLGSPQRLALSVVCFQMTA